MARGKLRAAVVDADGGGRLTISINGKDCVLSIPPAGVEQLGSRGILHRGEGRLADGYRGESIDVRVRVSWRVGGESGRSDAFEDNRWAHAH